MSFPGRAVQRAWHLVDAKSQTVGRLAAQIAPLLKGKHKPTYRPNGDCGDYVVVINAEKVPEQDCRFVCKLRIDSTLLCVVFGIGQLFGKEVEGQIVSMAHWLSRWFEATTSGRAAGEESETHSSKGHPGDAVAQQTPARLH